MELELVPEDDEQPQDGAKAESESTPAYTGPERRKGERRQQVDRREMMRFEAKSGRRSGNDRRKTVGVWKHRDF